MKKVTVLFIFILTCSFISAQNYYIKFDGIDGESASQTHQKWSNIESFSQQMGNIVNKTIVTRARNVSSLLKVVSIVKKIDKTSPKIIGFLAKERVIPKVKIEIVSANKVIYSCELLNVKVSKYNVLGSRADWPMEEFSLSFEEQTINYSEYDKNGKLKGDIQTQYK